MRSLVVFALALLGCDAPFSVAPGDLGPPRIAAMGVADGTESLAGVHLVDAVAVDDLGDQDALACSPPGQPFDLAWLAEGRCLRPDLLGARVVVRVP